MNEHKTGLYQLVKIMEFTQMTEVDVTSHKNYTFNQRGEDPIHAVSLTKYHKYTLI